MLEPLTRAESDLDSVLQRSTEGLTEIQIAAQVDAAFGGISNAIDRIPRETFDTAPVLARVGRDPNALLQWVTRETEFVPYSGVLRGAAGVLMDRTGNTLDRSLLLAELLKRSGHQSRLARATLQKEGVERVLTYVQTHPRKVPVNEGTEAAALEVLAEYASSAGGRPKDLKEIVTRTVRAGQQLRDEVIRRTDIVTGTLMHLTSSDLAHLPETWRAQDVRAIGDHWWVQVHTGGLWVDLDPLASAWDGIERPQAEETLTPHTLGDDRHHAVRLTVGIECACDGSLKEVSLLDRRFRVAELAGSSVTLTQGPAATAGLDVAAADAQRATAWLNGQDEWVAGLAVGGKPIAVANFTTAGQLIAPGARAGSPAGGLLDAFGGGDETPQPAGRLTAEFIDYEIFVPGEPPRKERRYLVDSLRTNANAPRQITGTSGSALYRPELVTEVDILILGAQPSQEFIAYRNGRHVLSQRAALTRGLRQLSDNPAEVFQSDYPTSERFPAQLYALATARMDFSKYGSAVYIAEPTILTKHEGLTGTTKSDISPLHAFDIVANSVRVRAVAGMDPVRISVNQGVVDSHTEVVLVSKSEPSINVAETMLADPNPVHWRIEQKDGHRLIVPNRTETATEAQGGWWRIDVSDGTVLAFTSKGWGGTQAMQELGFTTNEAALRTMNFIGKILGTLVCMFYQAYKAKEAKSHLATGLASVGVCMVTGLLSSYGGIFKLALGQGLSAVGTGIGLGWAIAAMIHAIAKAFGGANFTSRK